MAQVSAEHYEMHQYEDLERYISYWYQVRLILERKPDNVLEIGGGSGFLKRQLTAAGVDVTTADFAEDLQPDIVADVRDLPVPDGAYDLTVCFQVLEHLPFEYFRTAVKELSRTARRQVIISLPNAGYVARVRLFVPKLRERGVLIPLDWLYRKAHVFDGEHYWEINKRGYPLERITQEMEAAGFNIEQQFRCFEFPYHHFFVLRPREIRD